MIDSLGQNFPERIRPYIPVADLNQPIPVASGPFRLVGPTEGVLNGELIFRWVPSTALEFEGSYAFPHPDIAAPDWVLESENDPAFSAPVLVTHVAAGIETSIVRGIVRQGFSVGHGPFDTLRFCLVNFPEYIGAPVSYDEPDRRGAFAGRLHVDADLGDCRLDEIPEAAELVKRARRDAGFVISHVGQLVPASMPMTLQQAEAIIRMLHFWFGLLRGAWTGPVFSEGLSGGNVVWRQFAAWRIGERPAATWFPQRTPIDLSSAFRGFAGRWNDPAWQDPLASAISWLVEANSPRVGHETRIVLAQVALELLAWVHVVETQCLHSRNDFRRLSAAGRIRILLQQLSIPSAVPDYLRHVPAFDDRDAFDGPGVITAVRNALVHATDQNRKAMAKLEGLQWFQCGQLALHYLELVLLAVCGHDGHYARRGWEGWKGEDEVQVPWLLKG